MPTSSPTPSFISDEFLTALSRRLQSTGFRSHDAEDAVQEAAFKAIARFGREPIEQPEAYLFTAARNAARKSAARRREHTVGALREPETAPLAEIDEAEELHYLSRAILSAVEQLPPLKREIVSQRYFDGRTVREVADSLGLGHGSVRRHLEDARETLRLHLLENCAIARRRYGNWL